jgi:hypothetical protein
LLLGCYAYRPIASGPPPAGEDVRVALTDSGAVILAAQLGPSTEEVSGRVLADSGGTYLLAVRGTRRRGGVEMEWNGEQVAVPRIFVARAEERRFSRRRTVVAAVGLVTAAIVARAAFWGPGGVFGGAPPGGGPAPR